MEGEPLVGESFLDLAVPMGGASSPVRKIPEAAVLIDAAETAAEVGANACARCGSLYESEADDALKSPWVGCAAKKCLLWIHARCGNIFYRDDDAGFKALDTWASEHVYCKKHMPK